MSRLPETVIVVGASGFIGRNIVDALADQTRLIAVNSAGGAVAGCEHAVALAGIDSIRAVASDTAIVHVAAFRYDARSNTADQERALVANAALTQAVYDFAARRGITEIRVASSQAVYPGSWEIGDDARDFGFGDPPRAGEAAYAWSKRLGEAVANQFHARHGINTISFRLTNPYGPHDTLHEDQAHVATAFAIRALGDAPGFAVYGNINGERDFVYAGDVAACFVASLRLRGKHTALNCAQGQGETIRALAEAAMRAAGRMRDLDSRAPPNGVPQAQHRRATAARLRDMLPELAPFKKIDEGMRLTVAWYRDALAS
jgi:nucleoside-diphosphate-sugar epimerase